MIDPDLGRSEERPTSSEKWLDVLTAAFTAAADRLGPSTLAYLAATRKVEEPLRDAAAAWLHQHYASKGFLIAREWRTDRRDMAILDPAGLPLAELEAKALYGFDVARDTHREAFLRGPVSGKRANGHARDVAKLAPAIRRGTAAFLLSTVTHPVALISPIAANAVKYADGHNRAVAGRGGDAADLREYARRWRDDLATWGTVTTISPPDPLGKVYDVPIALDIYLVQLGQLSLDVLARLPSEPSGTRF